MGLSYQQKFNEMVSTCRHISLNKRVGITEIPYNMNAVQFAREYMIVGLLLPRQSGKTMFGTWLVQTILKSGSTAIFLTFNHHAARSVSSTFQMPEGSVMSVQELIARSDIEQLPFYDFVFIDEPSICFKNVSEYQLLNLVVNKDNLASQEILMFGTY